MNTDDGLSRLGSDCVPFWPIRSDLVPVFVKIPSPSAAITYKYRMYCASLGFVRAHDPWKYTLSLSLIIPRVEVNPLYVRRDQAPVRDLRLKQPDTMIQGLNSGAW